MSSLKEIAQLAGVSHATVSKALSGRYSVHPETRDRILALAKLMNYQPSALGRALVSGKTSCIGIYFNRGRMPGGSFSALFQGASDMLHDRGYHAMLLTSGGPDDPVPAAMRARMVDGVVIAHARDREIESFAEQNGMQTVLLNTETATDRGCVVADNESGMSIAVEHLASLGHRRIAFVNSPYPGAHVSQEQRSAGYIKAMAQAGLAAFAGSELNQPVAAALDRLFASPAAPTALVCFNDTVAMAVIHGLRGRGLRTPEDVSVIGCDDEQEAVRYFSPPLTTLRIPFGDMGAQAVGLLLSRIEGNLGVEPFISLPLKLIVRESTAPPADA